MFKIFLGLLVVLAVFSDTLQAGPIECRRPNEMYACGSACQRECSTLGQPCPIVNIRCNDACYCKDGYARNSNGVCIPMEEC